MASSTVQSVRYLPGMVSAVSGRKGKSRRMALINPPGCRRGLTCGWHKRQGGAARGSHRLAAPRKAPG